MTILKLEHGSAVRLLALLFQVASNLHGAALAWDPGPESDIRGYKVYLGIASRSYSRSIDVGNTTSWPIIGLQAGTEYFFAVAAYTTNGRESAKSHEVRFTPGSFSSFHFSNGNLIPDGQPLGLRDDRFVASPIVNLSRVRVTVQVASQFNGNLYCNLVHLGSVTSNFCVLLNRPGRSDALPWGYDDSGIDVAFESSPLFGDVHLYRNVDVPPAGAPVTGIWQPDGRDVDPYAVLDTSPRSTSLASFVGVPATGIWSLFLADADFGALNVVHDWGLELIGQVVPSVSWPTLPELVYGEPLEPAILNGVPSVPGIFTCVPPPGTVLPAGIHTLAVRFIPDDSAAFVSISTNLSITVRKKNVTIVADNQEKNYGALTPPLTAFFSGFIGQDSIDSLETLPTLTTTAKSDSAIGLYPISLDGATAANYSFSYVPGTLIVKPAQWLTTLESSFNPALPGQSVYFTFKAASSPPLEVVPEGNVIFYVDDMATSVVLRNGEAIFEAPPLTHGSHLVAAEYLPVGQFEGVTNILSPPQMVNTPPITAVDIIRYNPFQKGVSISESTLLQNDTDPDGDSLTLVEVGSSKTSGLSYTSDGRIYFTSPLDNLTNTITYIVTDGYGAFAPGRVIVTVSSPEPGSAGISVLPNGYCLIRFPGVPGFQYALEHTEDISLGSWQLAGKVTANEFGVIEFVDRVKSDTSRFYRSVLP